MNMKFAIVEMQYCENDVLLLVICNGKRATEAEKPDPDPNHQKSGSVTLIYVQKKVLW